ncbi:MAG: ComEC/Rec2 family competence protein [Candidatus Paceibacterota bacterium]|jgi:competence protein ComEC
MFQNFKKYILAKLLVIFFIATVFIFYISWQNSHRGFTFAMLDVGQGDALFIESPTGMQILFDSGPNGKVLSKLSEVMPFYDKSIDAIIISHPDQDHIGGFLDVLKNYKVGKVFESGTYSDSKTYQKIEEEIKNQNIPNIVVKKDMKLDFGGGVFLNILFPDRDVSSWDTNDGSIVARLTYGNTSFMLTGDATKKTEGIILSENLPKDLQSTFLKAGHHGSHTSSSLEFVKTVLPKYSLISVGEKNKYGHPHKETLDIFSSIGSEIFRTDEKGTIVIKSDGQKEIISFSK